MDFGHLFRSENRQILKLIDLELLWLRFQHGGKPIFAAANPKVSYVGLTAN